MGKFKVGTIIALVGVGVLSLVLLFGGLGRNNYENYQIIQSVGGDVTVRDAPGYYLKWFATVWTMPKADAEHYSAHPEEGGEKDRSIRVTFNDGGTAQISTMIRFEYPMTKDDRLRLHRDFQGNDDLVAQAVRAHLNNCIKVTGPQMSSSEHQSSRKAEFSQLIEEQLSKGLFKVRRVEKQLVDVLDENGNPKVVLATEVVTDENGVAVIAQKSPLSKYGIEVIQFSVTGTEYDPQTLQQFAAKKESFLAAEKAKAQVAEETQQELLVIAKGKREVAFIEAEGNKEKMKATVEAQKRVEVAELDKQEAVTRASQKVEVAEQERLEQEVHVETAVLLAKEAEERAKATISLAEAEEQRILLGGAITEKDKVLAEIQAQRDSDVAEALSKVNVPSTLLMGGEGTEGESSLQSSLMNLLLLKHTGVITEE